MRVKREIELDRDDCNELLTVAIIARAHEFIGNLLEGEKFVVEITNRGTASVCVEKIKTEVAE